ncbi:hypothetical protein Runsl_3302 [Runella slithyformis DSM 19594]|uniref:Uncharacterized protein n=1 Tax=Runella slithyformis (strain ATCC 29530 / DSM 19594 / LMG 11500 / NCIMB 11436 / LSU 4) TaxID=761193 RepID=A0A7U4E6K1_RUNSL|nr:hypothetical protein Runsl_3302 [Runella slithyformis DSM 19594]
MEKKKSNRNYNFISVSKDKVHYESYGKVTEIGMFYRKECLYCKVNFEARRIDTAFCTHNCQKAYRRREMRAN